MKTRTLASLTLLVALMTTVWVILLIVSQAGAPPPETLAKRVALIRNQGALHTANYLNAGLLTLANVALFAGFVSYTWETDRLWSVVTLAFVPVYGAFNTLVYLSQVFVVPGLIQMHASPETSALAEVLLGLVVQDWAPSAAAFVNLLAYAVLGIPSILLGWLLPRKNARLRLGAILLAASGVLSLVALVGLGVQNAALMSMTLVSGFLYLVALLLIGFRLLRRPE